jgi:bifunctional DNA-binding transcriptional regulator/antitoxin component of YhaV-PrlF toxin-antitoxin module
MNAVTRLEADGKISIPADVIAAAHLNEATPIDIEIRADGVLLKPRGVETPFRRTTLADLEGLRLYSGPAVPVEEISSVSEEWLRQHYAREFPGR